MNWKAYWASYPARFSRTDYLRQVKNTVRGEPISAATFHASLETICERIELGPDDVLLDLCCGNGVATAVLAERCRRVVGVDFSETLLEVARRDHDKPNVVYVASDVRDLSEPAALVEGAFSKVVMIGALQYVRARDLDPILAGVVPLMAPDCVAIIAGVPNRALQRRFYRTGALRLRAVIDRVLGRDQMGTWWDREFIERICARYGLHCKFYLEDAQVTGYRFDVKITRR